MPQQEKASICCPGCGREKDITILFHAITTFRVAVKDGVAQLENDLLREPQLAGTEVIARYSGLDGKTRIILFEEDSRLEIDCPKCGKAFDLPEGTTVECKGVK